MSQHDTQERIARRNQEAAYHIRETIPPDDGFAHAKAKLGLIAANTLDELTEPFDNKENIFVGMTASGAVRGAFYGVAVTSLAVACFSIPAVLVLPLCAFCMAIGAAGYGMIDGQTELELQQNHNAEKLSDHIARESGAVPSKLQEIKVEEAFRKSPEARQYTEEVKQILTDRGIKVYSSRQPGSADFVENETLRRRENTRKSRSV